MHVCVQKCPLWYKFISNFHISLKSSTNCWQVIRSFFYTSKKFICIKVILLQVHLERCNICSSICDVTTVHKNTSFFPPLFPWYHIQRCRQLHRQCPTQQSWQMRMKCRQCIHWNPSAMIVQLSCGCKHEHYSCYHFDLMTLQINTKNHRGL